MFRAALVSIVFSLALGQSVAVLCRTWCDAHVAGASECHHKNSSSTPSVAGDEHCDNVVVAATAVLREDVRRDVSAQVTDQAITVRRYLFAQRTIGARTGEAAWRARSLEKRPLSTALRI